MGTHGGGKLHRVLGFKEVFFIAVGQIIGAGVIVLTGIAIGMTGAGVIPAYLCSAVLILIVSLLLMMGGSAIPSTGAFYTWPSRLLNGWIGSIVLGLILLSGVSLALYGIAFGEYIHPVLPWLSPSQWGIIIITVFFIANLLGLRIAIGVQMVSVLILISALSIYAGFAVPCLKLENLTPMFPNGAGGFLTATILLTFATGGAMLIVMLGGEMKNPQRDIPLVVVSSTIIVAILYAFVALASVGVIPCVEMANKPLTVAGKAFLPGWAFSFFLVGGAGLAICTTLNSQYMQYPRNFLIACRDRVLPERLGRINRFGTPHYILVLLYMIGLLPLVLDLKVEEIARATAIAAFLPQAFQFWALSYLPDKFPGRYKESLFKLPRRWIKPLLVFSELGVVVGVVMLAYDLTMAVIVTLAVWIVVCVAYYPLRRAYMRKRGVDLDATSADYSVFEENVLETLRK